MFNIFYLLAKDIHQEYFFNLLFVKFVQIKII